MGMGANYASLIRIAHEVQKVKKKIQNFPFFCSLFRVYDWQVSCSALMPLWYSVR